MAPCGAVKGRPGGHGWRKGGLQSAPQTTRPARSTAGHNKDWGSEVLRLTYSSLTTPFSTYEYSFAAGTLAEPPLHVRPVPAYDAALYRTERLVATAPLHGHALKSFGTAELAAAAAEAGRQVPISLVYRADKLELDADGRPASPPPVYLYGYGASPFGRVATAGR